MLKKEVVKMPIHGYLEGSKQSFNKKTNQNGITLIALVVTLVVLLILAGISINLLWGEHGILKSAKDAGISQKIAEIEDQANVIYKGIETEKLIGTKENIEMGEIASKLQASGYKIRQETASGNVVTGITLDKESLTLAPEEEKTITVTPVANTEGNEYYAQIEGKYYKMGFITGGVKIAKEESNLEGEPEEINIEVSSDKENVANKTQINGMVVTIKAGTNTGKANITIKYGEHTATCEVTVQIKPAQGATAETNAVENVTFSTEYGKIDVIWLEGATNNVKTNQNIPNEPNLYEASSNSLTPVTWTYDKTEKTWSEDETAQSTWYNYSKGEGTLDNRNSMWANAKNTDGSYFVWIPRYAYRITYYANDPTVAANVNQEPTGYYDGYGMWKASDAKLKCNLESGIETVEHNGEKYIVHPAFGTTKTGESDKQANLDLGGWDKPQSGFWVAKYEMSMEENKAHKETTNETIGNVATSTTIKAVSKPGVSSWRMINVANCYENSLKYDETKASHLMKNSEWGAVAYLTESSYGRNGHEIDINNSSSCITGNGGNGTATAKALGVTKPYNTEEGTKASSTGNIYGIYDLSGGAWEYTGTFNKNYSGDCFSKTHANYKSASNSHFAETNGASTKYATAYSNNTENASGAPLLYSVSKTGDGIKEVYNTNTPNTSWHGDYAYFVSLNLPFFWRGGSYSDRAYAGVFYSSSIRGAAYGNASFRCVLGAL